MPITISWDTRTSIHYHLTGLWDWPELETLHNEVFDVIRESDSNVDLIFDMRYSIDMPIGALTALRRMSSYTPHNLGIVAVVTMDKAATFTFTMLGRFDPALGRRFKVYPTLVEARVAIAQREYHHLTSPPSAR